MGEEEEMDMRRRMSRTVVELSVQPQAPAHPESQSGCSYSQKLHLFIQIPIPTPSSSFKLTSPPSTHHHISSTSSYPQSNFLGSCLGGLLAPKQIWLRPNKALVTPSSAQLWRMIFHNQILIQIHKYRYKQNHRYKHRFKCRQKTDKNTYIYKYR